MLAENLKRIRLEQRYTRRQLGELVGVTPGTIQRIETGEIDNPTLKTLTGLAKVLKVSVNTLIK